jgi:hypothetical protein
MLRRSLKLPILGQRNAEIVMAPRIVRLLLENSPPVDDGVTEKPGFNELETLIGW